MKEEWIEACVAHPLTQIASDGGWDGGIETVIVNGAIIKNSGGFVADTYPGNAIRSAPIK